MTFDAARPRYLLPFAGKEYQLTGTFELIEAVEAALKDGVVQIVGRVLELSLTDTARLISAMLMSCGHRLDPRERGKLLAEQVGPGSDELVVLKLHLTAFLRILLEAPEGREAKAGEMGEMIGEWTAAQAASRGGSTRSSA